MTLQTQEEARGNQLTNPYMRPLSSSPRLQELIEAATKSGNVNLSLVVQDEDWVAIRGDRASLEFLGNLLLTFAKEEGPSFLNLDTELPLFNAGSEGIILYRNP